MTEQELRNLAAIEQTAKQVAKEQRQERYRYYTELRRKHEEKKELKELGL